MSGGMYDPDQAVILQDSVDSDDNARVVDGRLWVEATFGVPQVPDGSTAVSDEEVNTISSGNWQNFNVPTGETITIQRFYAGSEGEGDKGALVYLVYDQAPGQPVQDMIIPGSRLYVRSATQWIDLNYTIPRPGQAGDRIRIRRIPLEGSTQEIYGRWEGYY